MEWRGRAIKSQFNKGTEGMSTPRRSFISAVLESRACDRAASGMVCVHVRLTDAFRSRETNQSLRLAKRMLVFDAQQPADSFDAAEKVL
jgi:hypothetical protein